MKLIYNIDIEEKLDIKRILKEKLSISDRLYKKIKENNIYLNDKHTKTFIIPNVGDILTVDLDFFESSDNIVPNKEIKFEILYEDSWLLVVNKSPNLPVHPSLNHYENSLANGVKYYFEEKNLHKKIRPVNRLDKDTSGIVIFAKSEYIQENLKNYTKEYLAIVLGHLEGSGVIDKPIARKENSIIERCIDTEKGDKAITDYNVLKNMIIYDSKNIGSEYSLVKCKLETGRTHQIRVHMASIGHPILGDTLYGKPSNLISRQALHAYHISFIHPVTRENINIFSPFPDDFNKLVNL